MPYERMLFPSQSRFCFYSHAVALSHSQFLVSHNERGTENIINVFRYFVLFSSLRWLFFQAPFYVCYNYYVLAWILLIKESGCWFNWIFFFNVRFVHLSHTLLQLRKATCMRCENNPISWKVQLNHSMCINEMYSRPFRTGIKLNLNQRLPA